MPNPLDLVVLIQKNAVPLNDETDVSHEVLSLIGDARLVLIGEATHGTREFYKHRAAITKKLIKDRGFSAVAVEAGFSNARRIDRYARHSDDKTAKDALGNFQRFPLWIWRNEVMLEFVEWRNAAAAIRRISDQKTTYSRLKRKQFNL